MERGGVRASKGQQTPAPDTFFCAVTVLLSRLPWSPGPAPDQCVIVGSQHVDLRGADVIDYAGRPLTVTDTPCNTVGSARSQYRWLPQIGARARLAPKMDIQVPEAMMGRSFRHSLPR